LSASRSAGLPTSTTTRGYAPPRRGHSAPDRDPDRDADHDHDHGHDHEHDRGPDHDHDPDRATDPDPAMSRAARKAIMAHPPTMTATPTPAANAPTATTGGASSTKTKTSTMTATKIRRLLVQRVGRPLAHVPRERMVPGCNVHDRGSGDDALPGVGLYLGQLAGGQRGAESAGVRDPSGIGED
jgi:mRNA-degrading endonuclease toxin of MazEF toxin-antitoxin module